VLDGDGTEAGLGVIDEDLYEISVVLHHRWSEAHRTLDTVKAEVDDRSADWAAFHESRLERAGQAEADTRGLRDRFMAEHRDAIRRGMGL